MIVYRNRSMGPALCPFNDDRLVTPENHKPQKQGIPSPRVISSGRWYDNTYRIVVSAIGG